MHPDFATILNWRLLAGSHPFPGPDGGTCINEAAVVAAGLPYRAIRSSEDCPPCFSAPLATYALGLNDAMPDAERPRLMAFVLRLAGSADIPAINAVSSIPAGRTVKSRPAWRSMSARATRSRSSSTERRASRERRLRQKK